MPRYFTVLDDITSHYKRFNAMGREPTARMTAPPQARHFASGVDEVFEYLLRDLDPSGMTGISIHNADNQQDRLWG